MTRSYWFPPPMSKPPSPPPPPPSPSKTPQVAMGRAAMDWPETKALLMRLGIDLPARATCLVIEMHCEKAVRVSIDANGTICPELIARS